jgi:hypothetical protein
MRRMLTTGLLLSAVTAFAQTRPPTDSAIIAALPSSTSAELPDAPTPATAQQAEVVTVAQASFKATGDGAKYCGFFSAMKVIYFDPNNTHQIPKPCTEFIYPYQRFLDKDVIIPLSWQDKGYLALHDLADPANLGTILGISAISVGADSHSAYGPGMKGYGKTVGVSLLQDATGQFFGAFAIPSIFHQDPRYFRMRHSSIPRRILYAVSRSYVSRSDDGRTIPNYSTFLTYPITAEIANLYVPGIQSDAASTTARIATAYALDPVGNLLVEFLPDVASRVHVRVIFVQRILNNIASSNGNVILQ